MRIEVWSDVICPWCYIGKRRLETALAGFAHADDVEVIWRSFQLDPEFPADRRLSVDDYLAAKTGQSPQQVRGMTDRVSALAAAEGLSYDFDAAVLANTFDAHRLAHLGAASGRGGAVHERLLRAHLVEGRDIGDPPTLVELAADTGIPAREARLVLAGDAYADDVRADVETARELGVTGVPFFVLDRRYGISGAQPVEAFAAALEKAHADAQGIPA